jgi:hypothetical protein
MPADHSHHLRPAAIKIAAAAAPAMTRRGSSAFPRDGPRRRASDDLATLRLVLVPDILDPLIAKGTNATGNLSDLVAYRTERQTPGFGERPQPRGDVDPVTKQICPSTMTSRDERRGSASARLNRFVFSLSIA